MIQILQIVLFFIGLLNQDPSRVSELQQVQAQITQDLGTQVSTSITSAPVSTPVVTTPEPTNVEGTEPVETAIPQSPTPLTFTFSPSTIPTNATTTVTISASQGVFQSGQTVNLNTYGIIPTQTIPLYNISSDGTQASFDIVVPDGEVTDIEIDEQNGGFVPKGFTNVNSQGYYIVGNINVQNVVSPETQ